MVRNVGGGNKGKKGARKHISGASVNQRTRFSEDPDEIYACCQKLLGNGMFQALGSDKVERVCIIRNKFKGRNKRDNIISVGTWVLIGRRDFQGKAKGDKLEKCDLLEVYKDADRKKLKEKETHIMWHLFDAIGVPFGEQHQLDPQFEFRDDMPNLDDSDDEEETNKVLNSYEFKEDEDDVNIEDI